jgi:hypothetical protein
MRYMIHEIYIIIMKLDFTEKERAKEIRIWNAMRTKKIGPKTKILYIIIKNDTGNNK